MKRPKLLARDRLFWVLLSRLWKDWRSSLHMVQADTMVKWYREDSSYFGAGNRLRTGGLTYLFELALRVDASHPRRRHGYCAGPTYDLLDAGFWSLSLVPVSREGGVFGTDRREV